MDHGVIFGARRAEIRIIVRHVHRRGLAELARGLRVGVELLRTHIDAVAQRLVAAYDVQRRDADVIARDQLRREIAGAVGRNFDLHGFTFLNTGIWSHFNTFLILFNKIFLNSLLWKGGCRMQPKLVVITGPTASGKTALGVMLAQRLGGEVVSADSMQIYRGMDIGTAKPTPEEMQGRAAPHDRHRRPDGELLRLALRGGSDRLRGRYPRARKTADRRRRDGALHRLAHRRAHLCRRHGRHRAAAGAERALRRDRRRGSARRAAQI